MNKVNIPLILIFIAGLLVRLWRVDIPLLEFYPTRQVQTAEITRNLYREGFDIFSPSVHFNGPGSGLFLLEFPLYNLTVAALYAYFGFESETLGRIVSILGWVVSFIFLWKLSTKYIGKVGTTAGLFFYTFSPLSILISRSFQPDQWMLTLTLGAIYFVDKWSEKTWKIHWYLLGMLSLLVALLIKIPVIIFALGPIAFILFKTKIDVFLKIVYFVLALLPSLVWYAFILTNKENVAFVENVNRSYLFSPKLLTSFSYYSTIFGHLLNVVILPVGIVFFTIGFFTRLAKGQYFFYWWFVTVAFYFLFFNIHNAVHEYYSLPILPIAALFIGIGFEKILKQLRGFIVPEGVLISGIFFLIFLTLLPPTLTRAYKPIERFSSVTETAKAIQRLTSANDLIIGSMDAGPTLVYYADRTGWGLDLNPERLSVNEKSIIYNNLEIVDPIEGLEKLRRQGAVIFASAYKEQFLANERFSAYMFQKYPVLVETNNYIIFDLLSSLEKATWPKLNQ